MHESGEDYLETIYNLAKKNGEVRATDIANEFNYAKPSITKAIKKLKAAGFVDVVDNNIRLTTEGKSQAERIYDRHITLKSFLMQNGVSAETAEKDACRIEHYISEETYESLKKQVKNDKEQ